MLPEERQRIIVEKANKYGQVLVNELATEFGVSDETIRRDINTLTADNQIKKVHGGAVPLRKNIREEIHSLRVDIDRRLKEKIGVYATRFINDNEVIAFDNGTTIDELASAIHGVRNVTIILSSISALNILIRKYNNGDFTGQIFFLGGKVVAENYYTQGSLTLEQLDPLTIDKAFISCTSVSSEGLKAYVVEEGIFSSAIIKKSNLVYLLASSNKFNKESLYKLCDLDQVDYIVTDNENDLTQDLINSIQSAGINLHVVQ